MSYRGYVLRRSGRWTADLPGALAMLCGIAWVAGLAPDLREQLGAYVWGALGLAIAFGALWWLAWRRLRWEIVVDERGVQMVNRAGTRRAIGKPRVVTHGRFDATLSAGVASRQTPHVWVALETAQGEPIVFQRAMGVLDRWPRHWPVALPPVTRETYSSVGFDPVAFLAGVDPAER